MTRSREKIEGFKYRLAGELKTLSTRIEKLSKFLASNQNEISLDYKHILHCQLSAMQDYKIALEKRLKFHEVEVNFEEYPEVIVCAANKFSVNGKELVIHGTRHYAPDMHVIINTFEDFGVAVDEISQGFITNRGRYVNREEALRIAEKNDQVKHSIGYDPDELYSEMLY